MLTQDTKQWPSEVKVRVKAVNHATCNGLAIAKDHRCLFIVTHRGIVPSLTTSPSVNDLRPLALSYPNCNTNNWGAHLTVFQHA